MDTAQVERSIQEVWSLFKETDRRFQETDRKWQETDRRFQESDRRLDRAIKSSQRELKKMSKTVEALTGKWGKFVEGLLAPGVVRLFRKKGIEVEQVFHRAKSQRHGKQMEIDLLASNGEYVIAIEAKSSLSVNDVREHLDKLTEFKEFFPQYKNHRLVGAVAGIVIEEDADRFAYKSGLFVIGQTGDSVTILNDEKFVPRVW